MKQGSAQSHVERVEIHSCFCVGPKCERGPPSAAIFALSEQSASRFASIALVLPSSCLFVVQLMALAMILTETQHRQMLLNKRDELERSILKHKEALRDDRILLKETQNALDKYKRKGAKEQVTLIVQATEPTPNKKGEGLTLLPRLSSLFLWQPGSWRHLPLTSKLQPLPRREQRQSPLLQRQLPSLIARGCAPLQVFVQRAGRGSRSTRVAERIPM